MPAGIGLMALSLLGQALASQQSAKQNQEYDALLQNRYNDLQSRFERELNTPFLDTEQARSAIKLLNKQHNEQVKAAQNSSIITGSTVEGDVAAKKAAQDNYDTALTRLAGYGTQREDALNQRRDYLEGSYFRDLLANMQSKQQNWTNLMGNLSNVGQSAAILNATGEGGGNSNGFLSALIARLFQDQNTTGGTIGSTAGRGF